jgi:hypothetical protein
MAGARMELESTWRNLLSGVTTFIVAAKGLSKTIGQFAAPLLALRSANSVGARRLYLSARKTMRLGFENALRLSTGSAAEAALSRYMRHAFNEPDYVTESNPISRRNRLTDRNPLL